MKKIGNVEIKSPSVLAPMAGVTNLSFRTICKQYGAGLVYSEMISDKGLLYDNDRTNKMIEASPDESPLAIQLFGNDYQSIVDAAKLVCQQTKVDIIDVNMGCPVNKVVKSGSGSALLQTPDKIYDIIKALKDNIDKPITIKIRAGWDHQQINCDQIAKIATAAGVDAIAIHGRTRSSMYHGNVNLEYIKMVKDNTDVIVIGNGDIDSGIKAQEMIDQTGVDLVMVGRQAIGNPWIFSEINATLSNQVYLQPTVDQILDTLLDHAMRLICLTNERIALAQMRTHAAWYFKRLPFAKSYRARIVTIKTYQDLYQIVEEYRMKYR